MKMLPKLNLGVLSLALLFLMVINAANGRKYMGEYWGDKAIEGLVEAKWSDDQKIAAEYWAEKAIQTLKDVAGKHDHHKPGHHGEEEATTNKYFVTDFVVKPNLQC